MEQEGEDRGGGEENSNKQPQPQPPPLPPPPPPPPQQHQKCPRCESLNTKFCYYNNYSLSQPRYFCKSCKRYWTQGGTLRNIPVGGSRKGKRSNKSSTSSSSSSSSSSPSHKHHHRLQYPPQQHDEVMVQNKQSNLTTLVGPSPPTTTSPYSGYLSSLAAIHSLNPSSQSYPLNQSLNFGFNSANSLGSQYNQHSHINLPSRFYHMGNKGGSAEVGDSLYPAQQGFITPPSMGGSSSSAASHHHLDHDASLWSTISTTSVSGNSESNNIRGGSSSSSSLIPITQHWPHLPGYDPPE